MPILRRLFLAASALAVIAALVAVPGATASPDQPGAVASKKKGGKKPSCKKGYVAKRVTKKNGKKVWKCVKKKAPAAPCRSASASCAIPPPSDGRIFPAPGRVLEGEEARSYLKPYLPNSTFTDCVTGWPSCGGFENRYSHATDATFYKCLLRPTSGSDVKSVGEYGFAKAKIEADGSWYYQEAISWYGYYSYFEWHSTYTGVIEGAYQSSASEAPEKLGPLTYVGGVAKDCSY